MSEPQIASYKAEAKEIEGAGDAKGLKKMMEAIEEVGEVGMRVYTWESLAKAAQGPSNTLFMQIPTALNDFLESKTGINLKRDGEDMFSPEELDMFGKFLMNLLKKMGAKI